MQKNGILFLGNHLISHRLSTIEHCDRIYQLDQGKILKSGSYQEVVLGQ